MSCNENAAEGSTDGKVRYQQRLSRIVFGLVRRHPLKFDVHKNSQHSRAAADSPYKLPMMQAGTMQPAKLPAYMQFKRMCALKYWQTCVFTCALLARGVRALLLLFRLASVASTVAYVRLAVVAKEQRQGQPGAAASNSSRREWKVT
jgi:hypothetical protein